MELILAGWQETAAAGEGISSGAIESTAPVKQAGCFEDCGNKIGCGKAIAAMVSGKKEKK